MQFSSLLGSALADSRLRSAVSASLVSVVSPLLEIVSASLPSAVVFTSLCCVVSSFFLDSVIYI